MSIEDIDFLMQNCEVDSQIIYVDSAKRDKRVFPHPNHYSIKFNHDYRLVHGVEILDASLPATMFNVDVDNNVLSYLTSPSRDALHDTIFALGKLGKGFETLMNFATAHTNSPDDCAAVTNSASYGSSALFNIMLVDGDEADDSHDDVFLDQLRLHTYIYPCLNLGQLNADDNAFDGYVSAATSKSSTNLIFTRHKLPAVRLSDSAVDAKNGDLEVHEIVLPDGTRKYTADIFFWDFYTAFRGKYGSTMTFFDHLFMKPSPPKVARTYHLERRDCDSDIWDVVYYTVKPVSDDAFAAAESATSSALQPISLQKTVFRPGNYSAADFLETAGKFMTPNMSLDAARLKSILMYPYYSFVGNQPFVINMAGSSAGQLIGMAEAATDHCAKNYAYFKCQPQLFGSLAPDDNGKHYLHAPGIVNFAATRYVILRCEELEDHMFGSYSYSDFTPGVGLFRFFEVSGYSHQRVEYIKYDKAPFHPIGRLDKLTFTFMLPDLRNRYDFRGADHLMVLSIRYYVPKNKKKLERSVLNPSYNPDFLAYFQQYIDYKRDKNENEFNEYRSDEDDDDREYEDDRIRDMNRQRDVLQAEREFDWSEDSGEDGEGDDDVSDAFSDFLPTTAPRPSKDET